MWMKWKSFPRFTFTFARMKKKKQPSYTKLHCCRKSLELQIKMRSGTHKRHTSRSTIGHGWNEPQKREECAELATYWYSVNRAEKKKTTTTNKHRIIIEKQAMRNRRERIKCVSVIWINFTYSFQVPRISMSIELVCVSAIRRPSQYVQWVSQRNAVNGQAQNSNQYNK